MNLESIDATLAVIGDKTTKGGAIVTFVSFLASSQGAALIGIAGVIGGLAIQWYFNRRRDRREEAQAAREQAEHERRMGLME